MGRTIEQRSVDAVKALAVARAEVERLTKAIGAELAKCKGINGGLVLQPRESFGVVMYEQKDPNDITHLKYAYHPEVSESQYRRYDYMDDDEVCCYLEEECPHCLLAHQLVKQRRIARKKHGRAKATVTSIGNEMTKGAA